MKHPLEVLVDYQINRSEAQLLLIMPYLNKRVFTKNDFVKCSKIHKVNKIFVHNKKLWCYKHLTTLFHNKTIFTKVSKSNSKTYRYFIQDEDLNSIHKGIFEWYAYSGDVSTWQDLKIILAIYNNNAPLSMRWLNNWIIPSKSSLYYAVRRLKRNNIILHNVHTNKYFLNPKLVDFINVM